MTCHLSPVSPNGHVMSLATCFNCEGSHPLTKCNFCDPSKQPSSRPQPANPFPTKSFSTPIKVERLRFLLGEYFHSTVTFLLSGFTHGFPLHFEGERKSFSSGNLKSALQYPTIVDGKLEKELELQTLAGPFKSPFRVPPLGVVPKKTPGEYRSIPHLSFPMRSYVNDSISSGHNAIIAKAIQLIKKAGQGCFMAKTAIRNAFRIIPIRPDDYGLLGMQWRDLYYYHRSMPMGCSSSSLTFETFSTTVE